MREECLPLQVCRTATSPCSRATATCPSPRYDGAASSVGGPGPHSTLHARASFAPRRRSRPPWPPRTAATTTSATLRSLILPQYRPRRSVGLSLLVARFYIRAHFTRFFRDTTNYLLRPRLLACKARELAGSEGSCGTAMPKLASFVMHLCVHKIAVGFVSSAQTPSAPSPFSWSPLSQACPFRGSSFSSEVRFGLFAVRPATPFSTVALASSDSV